MLTNALLLFFLALSGEGLLLFKHGLDREFPMDNDPEDEPEVDELDIADEVALADSGRRWTPRLVPGQRGAV
ncbi:hypothetical protein ACFYWS_39530 [Streptomyces sp. NPDC002795]|uniref:hypothetical protein n=1 Tax=Streptomyces sp. NPDC002795 TaxID=3364665 RepID=UPI0036C85962